MVPPDAGAPVTETAAPVAPPPPNAHSAITAAGTDSGGHGPEPPRATLRGRMPRRRVAAACAGGAALVGLAAVAHSFLCSLRGKSRGASDSVAVTKVLFVDPINRL